MRQPWESASPSDLVLNFLSLQQKPFMGDKHLVKVTFMIFTVLNWAVVTSFYGYIQAEFKSLF